MAQDRLPLGLLKWVELLFYVIVRFQVDLDSQHVLFLCNNRLHF